jgi:hypothetical protein
LDLNATPPFNYVHDHFGFRDRLSQPVMKTRMDGLRDTGVRRCEFLHGIAGTPELFHRSTLDFPTVAEEATAHPVAVFQRIDQAGYKLPIDERILADTDTLMVFGLDHFLSQQEPAREEIAAITQWLE